MKTKRNLLLGSKSYRRAEAQAIRDFLAKLPADHPTRKEYERLAASDLKSLDAD